MVTHYVQPAYPDSARELGLGRVNVVVTVTIGPTGMLLSERINQSGGNMALDQAALMAAREMSYAPRIVNCQRVTADAAVTFFFDPKAPTSSRIVPVPGPTPGPSPPPCVNSSFGAASGVNVLIRRGDYDRAIQMARQSSAADMSCARSVPPSLLQRTSLEMSAAETLSQVADLAYKLGRTRIAREFAINADAIYNELLSHQNAQNSSTYTNEYIRANLQANIDLLHQLSQASPCGNHTDRSKVAQLVLSQMPPRSGIQRVVIAGNYATALAYNPGGYAARSFLLKKQSVWLVLTSEGGAFALSTYQRYHIPASVIPKLSAPGPCHYW